MWIYRRFPVLARMPSTRSQPLNPRLVGRPVQQSRHDVAPAAQSTPSAAESASDQVLAVRDEAARAGGFHESSYELKNGLEISESEWPTEITIPGALGEH